MGEEVGRNAEGGKTVTKMYYVRKMYFQQKEKILPLKRRDLTMSSFTK